MGGHETGGGARAKLRGGCAPDPGLKPPLSTVHLLVQAATIHNLAYCRSVPNT